MTLASVEKLLTVNEVIEITRLSRSKLHQEVRAGELRAVKFGRRTLFRAQDVQAYIDRHVSGPDRPTAKVRGI